MSEAMSEIIERLYRLEAMVSAASSGSGMQHSVDMTTEEVAKLKRDFDVLRKAVVSHQAEVSAALSGKVSSDALSKREHKLMAAIVEPLTDIMVDEEKAMKRHIEDRMASAASSARAAEASAIANIQHSETVIERFCAELGA